MIETQNWDKDWSIYKEDKNLSNKIIPIFESYLNSLLEKGTSKTTFNRHKNACHALAGILSVKFMAMAQKPFMAMNLEKKLYYVSLMKMVGL